MYTYSIYINPTYYNANLNVSDGKVAFEKDENSVIFRKRLDGKFSLNRSGNELLFDKLLALTFCEQGIMTVNNESGLVIEGSFRKKDLTISEDKCRVDIKFDKQDEYSCLDKIADKEFNILANYEGKPAMPIYSAKHYQAPNIEYATGYGYASDVDLYYSGYWIGDEIYPYPQTVFWPKLLAVQTSWMLYSNKYELVSAGSLPNTNNFNIVSTWAREVKLIIRLGENQTETPTNTEIGCDYYGWQFSDSVIKNGVTYDKFTRRFPQEGFENIIGGPPIIYDYPSFTMTSPITFDCGGIEYIFGRCRKLNDVITTMIYECFPTGFKSEFFKSTVNPISGRDLSNIMLSQKSDCIFAIPEEEAVPVVSSDPATKGIITFKNLMLYLQNMFQVYWAIDENGDFRIEHKKYWDNNGSYTVPNSPDIDLEVVYPIALIGTNEYAYEQNIPIRENHSFMESWNIDFIGTPISYEDCVSKGEEISYPISIITTDIDPDFLFSVASKDGFCMFHCNSVLNDDNSYSTLYDSGLLSLYTLPNVHLSVANLQDSYWKYGRYLPQGEMNAKLTDFDVRALKYQVALSFPYCFNEFNPQRLIHTNLGDGIVKSASFSFKTNFITVELEYIDSI